MAKRKSIRDIERQIDRIINASIRQTTDYLNSGRGVDGDTRDRQLMSRRARVRQIGERYLQNANKSATWQSAFQRGYENSKSRNSLWSYLNDYEPNAKTEGYSVADNTPISRSEYMGLING